MLSAVLRSDIAIRVNIRIMDTFVEMRKYMANTSLLYERLNAVEDRQINYQAETDERFGINLIQDTGIIKDILQRLELESDK